MYKRNAQGLTKHLDFLIIVIVIVMVMVMVMAL